MRTDRIRLRNQFHFPDPAGATDSGYKFADVGATPVVLFNFLK